jgi:hypothetical protein
MMLLVDSAVLEKAATQLREQETQVATLRNGVAVSPDQLETAARILKEAEPSVITSASGPVEVTLNKPQERPGFINEGRQKDPEVLVFDVGIIGDTYHINRKGEVLDP